MIALSREAQKNPFSDLVPTWDNKMYVQVRMWQHRGEIRRLLEKPDTLVYVCGLKGMEKGAFLVIDLLGQQLSQPDLAKRMRDEGRLLLEIY